MTRPRLLDLFCGAGGCAIGYDAAGFNVVGVDINPMPRYPFEFVQADAMTYPLDGFDVIHASPPCQDHSALASRVGQHGTGWMLDAIRQRLKDHGRPYVIENVANADMPDALVLCGASFGLGASGRQLKRHRRFESNVFLMGPPCSCGRKIIGVYGHGGGQDGSGTQRGYKANAAEARQAMGITHMNRAELSQAIPPAYTEYIGNQIMDYLTTMV